MKVQFLIGFRLLLVTAVTSSACGLANAADPCTSEDRDGLTALELSPDIRSVSSNGHWFHNGMEGWLRFVVIGGGLEHYTSRLFVQWFTQTSDQADIELLESVSVKELGATANGPAGSRAYTFEVPKCEQRIPCTSAVLDAFDTRTGQSLQFRILLQYGPGRYRIEPIENPNPDG